MTAATYDGNGMRASTTITPAGRTAVTQGYVWNTIAPVPQLLMDGTNAYIYADGNTPAEQVSLSTGTITYLVADSLGSVRGTVGSSGTLTGTTSYDAWGNPQTTGGLTAATPFGYAGGYTDPDGLIYLLNRYYNPQLGQFLSVDADLPETLQPYAYAADNPVNATDPTGLRIHWWAYVTTSGVSCEHTCLNYNFNYSANFAKEIASIDARQFARHIHTWAKWISFALSQMANIIHSHPAAVHINKCYRSIHCSDSPRNVG